MKQKKLKLIKLNENTFQINFPISNDINLKVEILLQYIKTIIPNAYLSNDSNISNNYSIIFNTESANFLDNQLNSTIKTIDMLSCIQLFTDLSKQIHHFFNNSFGYIGFDLDDLIIIDNKYYINFNLQYLMPLNKENAIFLDINDPIQKPYFSSPEIIKLETIPYKIHYKCIYYSLGTLITYALLNIYLLVGNDIKSESEIDNLLYSIQNTKIYCCIKRCLNANIKERILLFI
jgi:hypothetical protein